MPRTLTRLGLAAAVLTATVGLSGGVAQAAPATTTAAATAAQQYAKVWTYMGSYGRYEWCTSMKQFYWPAFDAQCVYNGYTGNYDLYVLM